MGNPLLDDIEARRRAALLEQAGEDDPALAPLESAPPPPSPAALLPDVAPPVSLAPPTPPPAAPSTPTPSPYGAGLDDAALKAAFDKKRNQALGETLSHAGAQMISAIGAKVLPALPRDNTDIEEIQARRAGIDQNFKATHERALAASDSPEARLRQQLGVRSGLATGMEDLVGQAPASELPDFGDYLKLQAAKLKAAAKTGPAGDPTATADGWKSMVDVVAEQNGYSPEQKAKLYDFVSKVGDEKSRRAALAGSLDKGLARQSHEKVAEKTLQATTNRYNTTRDDKLAHQFDEEVAQLSHRVEPKVAAVKNTISELAKEVSLAKNKYGDIPGIGLWETYTSQGRLPKMFLNSPEARKIQTLVSSINILNRSDITGAAFGEKEAADLSKTFAETMNSTDFMNSLNTLSLSLDGKLKSAFAGYKPEVVQTYLQRAPQMAPASFSERVDHPQRAPSAPSAPPLSGPGIREPSGALAPTPGGPPAALRVPPGAKEVRFQLANGKKVSVPADRVEEALQHPSFRGAKPLGAN